MSTIQTLRAFVNQKLNAAVEEIFELLETTFSNLEEEIDRQRRLLEEVSQSGCKRVFKTAGVKRQIWNKDDHREEKGYPNHEDPEPSYTEEEEEGQWNSREGEQLSVQKEEDTTLNDGSNKFDDDEAKYQSLRFHQRKTEGVTEATCWDRSRGQTREKKYSCATCGKSYTERKALVVHLRTHTGEKPYSCSTCERRFSQRKTLVVHLRSHTGERPFSCPFCEKSFSVSGTLTRHLRVHTGEKPYSCGVCEKSFSLLTRLKSHKCASVGSDK